MSMNAIDVLLAAVLLLAIWRGYQRGFISGTLRLLVLFGSLLLALLGYRFVAGRLEIYAPSLGVWTWPLSFVASWLLAQMLLDALAAGLLRAVPRRVHAHSLNRL